MKDIEVEIQVEIENIKPLVELMEKSGKFLYEEHQVDQYYTPAHRNFREKQPINEWLRLRNSNGKYSITYKNWHRDEKGWSTHCDEFESYLEKIDQIEKIFGVLDFDKVVLVDKNRKAYRYKDYEIAIDKVKDLGNFVEIEYKGSVKNDVAVITKEMIDFLKSLGLGKMIRNNVGYAFKLLYTNKDQLIEEL